MNKRTEFIENVLELKILQKKEEFHNLFKSNRNFLNKIARLSKANHYKTFSEDNKNKLNKVWEGIKEIININKKDTRQIRNINSNGKLTVFNHFFCNIPEQIRLLEKGIIPTQKTYDHFLTNPTEQ